MKKVLLGTLGVCLFMLLILNISAHNTNETSINDTNPKQILLKCKSECNVDKRTSHQDCINIHLNNSREIRLDYKTCLDEAKQEFKNKSANRSNLKEASKELASNIKNCTGDYLKVIKEGDNKRKDCFKNSEVNCEKKCQEEVCLTSYEPICGIDNKTYNNECQLKNASVKKACDGQCPCLVCKNYYWFDNNTKDCGNKKFCGTFMYQGLNIFEKRDDCKDALKNTTSTSILPGQCIKNEDCKTGEFCKKESCSSEKGRCTKVPVFCTMNYDPVCGCDGNTYSNNCALNSFKVNKKADGICFECKSDADCPQIMCFKAPCAQNKCIDNICRLIEANKNCDNSSGIC